ncbi:hypothetical protein MGMO_3c00060 [Methyloglobulus morosus KoM1]|uniref:Uncharacterized protein n=1 Tax=Methyloglobulus morosus KoM1 TaxID=1116472 RepID=V5C217_9GAMM|nr:hypothetical protein MGMO_3c00060 [Methyloglobulus morosus KoM1]
MISERRKNSRINFVIVNRCHDFDLWILFGTLQRIKLGCMCSVQSKTITFLNAVIEMLRQRIQEDFHETSSYATAGNV